MTVRRVVKTVIIVILVRLFLYFTLPLFNEYTQDIQSLISFFLSPISGVLTMLLVECLDASWIKFNYMGESSKTGSNLKLPPIYNERINPYFENNTEYNSVLEKSSRKGKGKEVVKEYIDNETRSKDLTKEVLRQIDKEYGIEPSNNNEEYKEVKKKSKKIPRISRNYYNDKLSSMYLTDTGIRPLDTNDIFNYRNGIYGYNSNFSHNPDKLKEVLSYLGNKRNNIGFETSKIDLQDYLSRSGSTAPILHRTVPINIRDLHMLDLPLVKYHPYGPYAPNFDPKQDIGIIEVSKNKAIREIDPFNIISWKELYVWL